MNCEDLRLVFDLLVFLVIILPQSQKSVVFAMNLDKYLFRFIVKMTIFWRRRESENYLVIVLCLDKAIFTRFPPWSIVIFTLCSTQTSLHVLRPCCCPSHFTCTVMLQFLSFSGKYLGDVCVHYLSGSKILVVA